MTPSKDPSSVGTSGNTSTNHADTHLDEAAELSNAYRELLRGEQAATALEANLSNLEGKLDALLAAVEATAPEKSEERVEAPGDGTATTVDVDDQKKKET